MSFYPIPIPHPHIHTQNTNVPPSTLTHTNTQVWLGYLTYKQKFIFPIFYAEAYLSYEVYEESMTWLVPTFYCLRFKLHDNQFQPNLSFFISLQFYFLYDNSMFPTLLSSGLLYDMLWKMKSEKIWYISLLGRGFQSQRLLMHFSPSSLRLKMFCKLVPINIILPSIAKCIYSSLAFMNCGLLISSLLVHRLLHPGLIFQHQYLVALLLLWQDLVSVTLSL